MRVLAGRGIWGGQMGGRSGQPGGQPLFALAAILTLGLTGCGDGAKTQPKAETAIPVTSYAVSNFQIQDKIAGTGTIAAARTTDIGPRVDGIVDAIWVRVGDVVSADQPLFRTRQREYDLSVKELEQKLSQAKADQDKAERDQARTADLKTRGVASQTALNDFTTKLEQAKAQAGVVAAQLDRARQAMADTIVRAPYAGVVTRRNVDEGTFMNSRAMGMPGGNSTAAIQIMEIDIVAAIVQVPSVHVGRLAVGTPGRVRIDGLDGFWESKIIIVNDRVDSGTRAVEVRLPIDNKDRRIKPGLYTRVELLPPPRDAIVVDRRVILGAEGDRYVFLAQGGKAIRRAVTIRDLDASKVEIIDGLQPGDAALAGPNIGRVSEGSLVSVESAPAA